MEKVIEVFSDKAKGGEKVNEGDGEGDGQGRRRKHRNSTEVAWAGREILAEAGGDGVPRRGDDYGGASICTWKDGPSARPSS